MTLRLTVGGDAYEGWITATVQRGLRRFAHSFTLQYVDKWSEDRERWPLYGGAPCTLSWNRETIVDGYLDVPEWAIDGDSLTLTASGRSRTGDLVDCSAVHETGHWKDQTATKIVKDLCKPFGLSVRTGTGVVDLDRFTRFALQDGERVHAAMDRVCKVRGLLPITTASGDVELYSARAPAPVLTLDTDSAIRRSYKDDTSQRYSDYLVHATGIEDAQEAGTEAKARDSGVERFRPLVIVVDTKAAKVKEAERRAIFEANVRAGGGQRLVYTFQDPTNLARRVYGPGQHYRVKDAYFGIDREMIVDQATLAVTADKVEMRVELVRPETYQQSEFSRERLVKKSKRKARRKAVNEFL